MNFASYKRGADVLGGVSFDDFLPYISAAGKAAGGLSGGFASGLTGGAINLAKGKDGKSTTTTEEAVKKALAEQQMKQQEHTTRVLLYSVIGVLAVGGTGLIGWLVFKK